MVKSDISKVFKIGIAFGIGGDAWVVVRRLNKLQEKKGTYEIYLKTGDESRKLSANGTAMLINFAEGNPIKFFNEGIALFHFGKTPEGTKIGFGEMPVPIDAYFDDKYKLYMLAKPMDVKTFQNSIKRDGTELELSIFKLIKQIPHIIKDPRNAGFVNSLF